MTTRIVFMGSPEFALPTLKKLAEHYSVVGVVTQPDRPAGRGREMKPPPVKLLAKSLGLPVIQPLRLRAPEALEQLRAWAPDLIVVAAFGQILRQEVLDLPPHGCLNVHASLLPRWRGAAPINAAILHGDEQTGVTIMRMDAGLDTGPILSQRAIPIEPEDTAATLGEKLARLGADLLIEILPSYLEGELLPQPQDETSATYAPMLKKENGWLDFRRPAEMLARQVRAYHPWPGTFYDGWPGGHLKVLRAHSIPEAALQPKSGERAIYHGLPAVRASDGWLVLEEVQPAGKKAMSGKTFLLGARNWA
jgi:methionyl-tRNA formyltransferase